MQTRCRSARSPARRRGATGGSPGWRRRGRGSLPPTSRRGSATMRATRRGSRSSATAARRSGGSRPAATRATGFERYGRELGDGGRAGFAATLACGAGSGCPASDRAKAWLRSVGLTIDDRRAPAPVAGRVAQLARLAPRRRHARCRRLRRRIGSAPLRGHRQRPRRTAVANRSLRRDRRHRQGAADASLPGRLCRRGRRRHPRRAVRERPERAPGLRLRLRRRRRARLHEPHDPRRQRASRARLRRRRERRRPGADPSGGRRPSFRARRLVDRLSAAGRGSLARAADPADRGPVAGSRRLELGAAGALRLPGPSPPMPPATPRPAPPAPTAAR